jgi:Tfp pilus assembly protein PilO
MEDILAIILIFGGGTAIAISFSPIGKAIANRIRGQGEIHTDPEVLAELDDLRAQLSEVQERLDFAERMLPKGSSLPPSGGGA